MKSILVSLLFVLPVSLQAGEVVLSCKLKALEQVEAEGIQISGIFTIEKLSTANLVMKADAVVNQEGEESEALHVEDKVALHELRDQNTIPTAEQVVAGDDNFNAIRAHLLGGHTISKLEVYGGESFQDDGAGLNLFTFTTDQGKTLTMVNVGWSFLLCE